MLFIILSLLFLLPGPDLLPGMSKSSSQSLPKVRVVELKDVDYRTLAVMPFVNETGNDYYSYIGRTIQKFLSEDLNLLKEIRIATNDIVIPRELLTNQHTIFSYSTNTRRRIVLLEPGEVFQKYLSFTKADQVPAFAEFLASDYLVHGQYRFLKNDNERFSVKYGVYNLARKKDVFEQSVVLENKDLEKGIRQAAYAVIEFFKPRETGYLKIIASLSNYQVLIDRVLVDSRLLFYELPHGLHQVDLKLLDQTLSASLEIKKERTNILYFTNQLERKGVLRIKSKPTDALVFLNVRLVGRTPLVSTNIDPGAYRLVLSSSNFQSVFQSIDIHPGTNSFSFKLSPVLSQADLLKQYKRNKKVMYWTLGTGTVSLLAAYYFLSRSQDEYDRYLATGKRMFYTRTNQCLTASFLTGLAGAGSMTVSFIYFLKVLNYDDQNIGSIKKPGLYWVLRTGENCIALQYRF